MKVLFQGYRPLLRDERFLAHGSALALTRDVVLYCRSKPVVYAHSVLQPGNRGAGWRLMQGMGTQPLGAALFTDPRIRRLMLRQRKLGRGHELHRQARAIAKAAVAKGAKGAKDAKGATRTNGPLWARRSLFMVGKSPILVTEVFLPGVLTL